MDKLCVDKLCVDKLCVGGGRAGAGAGRQKRTTKNKNPTQRCGEEWSSVSQTDVPFRPNVRRSCAESKRSLPSKLDYTASCHLTAQNAVNYSTLCAVYVQFFNERCFHMCLAFFNKKRRYRLKLDDSVARKKAGGRRRTEAFTHRSFYTEKSLHRGAPYTTIGQAAAERLPASDRIHTQGVPGCGSPRLHVPEAGQPEALVLAGVDSLSCDVQSV